MFDLFWLSDAVYNSSRSLKSKHSLGVPAPVTLETLMQDYEHSLLSLFHSLSVIVNIVAVIRSAANTCCN